MKRLILVVLITFGFASISDAAFQKTQQRWCGWAFGTVVSRALDGQSSVPLLPKHNVAALLPKPTIECPLPKHNIAGFLASEEVLKPNNPSLKIHYFSSADRKYSFCVPSEW